MILPENPTAEEYRDAAHFWQKRCAELEEKLARKNTPESTPKLTRYNSQGHEDATGLYVKWPDVERELQTATVIRKVGWEVATRFKDERDAAVAELSEKPSWPELGKMSEEAKALRTALATAEAREAERQKSRDEYIARLRANLGLIEGDPLTESCATIRRQLTEAQAAYAVIAEERESFQVYVDSFPHERRPILVGPIQMARWTISDLRRQLTEAQAASFEKDKALSRVVEWWFRDSPECTCGTCAMCGARSAISNTKSDLLKRLEDAERERDELKTCDVNLANLCNKAQSAELSRLQAELKDARDSARRELLEYCNRGGASWIATRQDILEAIAAIDAARTQKP